MRIAETGPYEGSLAQIYFLFYDSGYTWFVCANEDYHSTPDNEFREDHLTGGGPYGYDMKTPSQQGIFVNIFHKLIQDNKGSPY